MADLVVVISVVAFFGLCALYVVACDRIIGPAAVPETQAQELRDEEQLAAEVTG
jgi:hypothetical protein